MSITSELYYKHSHIITVNIIKNFENWTLTVQFLFTYIGQYNNHHITNKVKIKIRKNNR